MVLSVVFLALFALTLSSSVRANPRYASIVVDIASGEVLHAANADATRYPASLTKMMTLYLLFEALENGRVTLDQPLPVSRHAASMPASKLWLKAGSSIKVRDAIPALIIRSANDVAAVVAEALGGTESAFARLMTDKAREMGMNATRFRNASGLPDDGQVSTARDMAMLSMRLMNDFPQYYHHFSRPRFTYRGQTIKGHNRLLTNYDGADGLKTGYIRASGFNVATSAVRDGRRIVAVVMGGFTAQSRDAHMADLLDRGFVRASLLSGRDWIASADISGNVEPISASSPPSVAQQDRIAELASSRQTSVQPTGSTVSTPATRIESSFLAATQVVSSAEPLRISMSDAIDTMPSDDPIMALVNRVEHGQGSDYEYDQGNDYEMGGDWAVQVGAFQDADMAQDLAARAAGYLQDERMRARVAVTEAPERQVFRARLVDLEEQQARNACDQLARQGMECLVVR
ncbi:peptidase S11 [Litchfieldella qijiaojingensis]|uniref:Peptidase S11 n=2 Tax=Litchfieldella qijiaojingensis TaxID=980347 RepID=A0ABQ2Z1M4_9GAMM|nr:peptidase S11 [Halomonas qijiaojingensis]